MSLLAALAWLVPAGLGLTLAAWMQRDRGRGGWDWPRALQAAGPAALGTAAVWLLVRLFDWLAQGTGPIAWVGVAQPLASDPAPLISALLRLGLAAGLVFAAGTLLGARLVGPRWIRPPLAVLGAALALLAGLLVVGAFAAGPLAYSTALPLDLAAVVPVVAAGIAAGFLAPDRTAAPAATDASGRAAFVPGTERAGLPANPPAGAAPGGDPEALLQRANVIGKTAPAIALAATGNAVPAAAAGAPSDGPLDRIWFAAGGRGRAPEALRAALARLDTAGPGLLVGDLSAPTEAVFATALVTAALLVRAARVLVVTADPRGLCDRVAAAQIAVGAWRPGLAVAGDGELRDALARDTLPALIALQLGDLSGHALAARSPSETSWLAALDLVLLVRVDQLAPIESTDMAFSLRRLGLALDARRTRPAWVAIGHGTPGSRGYLEQATLGSFAPTPLGAAATAGVRVHFRASSHPAVEIRAAEKALVGLDDVQVEDATGALADPTGRRSPRPGYHGRVSLTLLEDRHLAALFRARTSLAHRIDGSAGDNVAIWWVPETPLAGFLRGDGALAALEQRDELPAPRPLAGLANPELGATHLQAALREGRPDEKSLRRAFGDAEIDHLLATRPDMLHGRRARWDEQAMQIDPAAILSDASPPSAQARGGIQFLEVKDPLTAAVLRRIDRRVAATRFYPHRIFRARGALVQVAGQPLAANATQLLVTPAPAAAVPTDPDLSIEVTKTVWQARPQQHTLGKLTFARGVAQLDVRESVSGAIPRGQAAPSARFAPVWGQYATTAAVIMFSHAPSPKALRHAGRLAADLLPAHLLIEREDVEVLAFPDGLPFGQVNRPTLAFVDRHVGGIGVAEALDPRTMHNLLRWTWGVLNHCPCIEGCERCSPASVLAAGPDKIGAIQLLTG